MLKVWKTHKVATINIQKRKVQEKLAAMPSVKNDTIKVTRNRIALLNTLRIRFQLLDRYLFEVLKMMDKYDQTTLASTATDSNFKSKRAAQLAKLLGIAPVGGDYRSSNSLLTADDLDKDILITRRILLAMMEVRKTNANIELEIVLEQDTLERLTRYRDTSIQAVNLANFYQIGILGVLADGVIGLADYQKAGTLNNRLTIISGLTAGGLAVMAFLMRRGGISLTKHDPNMLGPCLAIESPAKQNYTPLTLDYLSRPNPDSQNQQTRFELLLDYWQSMHLVGVDMKKPKNFEKVAAIGEHHHFWDENIKMIQSRVTMLFDLEAVVNHMEDDISILIKEI